MHSVSFWAVSYARDPGLNRLFQFGKDRLLLEYFSHFLRRLSELFLKFAYQFVLLAFGVGEVVVGQLSVLLFKLALDFIPRAFELEFIHIDYYSATGEYMVVSCSRFSTDGYQHAKRAMTARSRAWISFKAVLIRTHARIHVRIKSATFKSTN